MKYKTRESFLENYMPQIREDVKEILIEALTKYFSKHSERSVMEIDIENMFWQMYGGASTYEIVVQYTDNIFGRNPREKFDFWVRVLTGDN